MMGIGNFKIYVTLLLSLCVMGSAFAVIYLKHTHRVQHAKLHQLHKSEHALQIEWSKLLLEKGALIADSRVEDTAKRLGMIQPKRNRVILVEP